MSNYMEKCKNLLNLKFKTNLKKIKKKSKLIKN